MMRLAAPLLLVCCSSFGATDGTADLLRSALAAQGRGDLAAAVQNYREVLRAKPDLTQARTNMAAALAGLGRFDEAIEAYGLALKQNPGNHDTQANLALAYYRNGDAARAAPLYQAVHQARPADKNAAALLADCYLRLGKPNEALRVIEPLSKADPGDLNITYLRGMAEIRSGHADRGIALVEKVARETGSPDAFLLIGATQLNLGHLGPARENLDKAVKLNPGLPGALSWAGLARDKTGDEEGAKEAFLKALQQNPQDFDANLHYGAILYRQKNYQEAKPLIQTALRIQPSSAMARYAAALVQTGLGDNVLAIAGLEHLVQDSPNWIEPHVKLSSLYYKTGRNEDGQRQREVVDRLNSTHSGTSSPFEN